MRAVQRKTATEWSTENPVLDEDVVGVETSDDGIKTKIGDGVTAWNDLPYVEGDSLHDESIDELNTLIDEKQDKLIAGTNITIEGNTISASGGGGGGGISLNDVYPVGSIYMSVTETSPATLFGGEWERIKDTFLLASGDNYANGATGGESEHTLTVDEMPSHTHTQDAHKHTTASHSHSPSSQSYFVSTSATDAITRVSVKAGTGTATTNLVRSIGGGFSRDGASQTTVTVNNATATNQNTGGGEAHNNMPPYLAVYVWQRTA